jgi:hypothetical protein
VKRCGRCGSKLKELRFRQLGSPTLVKDVCDGCGWESLPERAEARKRRRARSRAQAAALVERQRRRSEVEQRTEARWDVRMDRGEA